MLLERTSRGNEGEELLGNVRFHESGIVLYDILLSLGDQRKVMGAQAGG